MVHRSKDCMKKFCEFSREHKKKIIDFKQEKTTLAKEQHEWNENAKICYICKEKTESKYLVKSKR